MRVGWNFNKILQSYDIIHVIIILTLQKFVFVIEKIMRCVACEGSAFFFAQEYPQTWFASIYSNVDHNLF